METNWYSYNIEENCTHYFSDINLCVQVQWVYTNESWLEMRKLILPVYYLFLFLSLSFFLSGALWEGY